MFVNCNPDGSFAWTATGYGYAGGAAQNIYSATGWGYPGGGGYFGSKTYQTTLYASAGGFVTTPTYYTQAGSPRTYASVTVWIGNASGYGTDTCD